jgi:hypothetical protein
MRTLRLCAGSLLSKISVQRAGRGGGTLCRLAKDNRASSLDEDEVVKSWQTGGPIT